MLNKINILYLSGALLVINPMIVNADNEKPTESNLNFPDRGEYKDLTKSIDDFIELFNKDIEGQKYNIGKLMKSKGSSKKFTNKLTKIHEKQEKYKITIDNRFKKYKESIERIKANMLKVNNDLKAIDIAEIKAAVSFPLACANGRTMGNAKIYAGWIRNDKSANKFKFEYSDPKNEKNGGVSRLNLNYDTNDSEKKPLVGYYTVGTNKPSSEYSLTQPTRGEHYVEAYTKRLRGKGEVVVCFSKDIPDSKFAENKSKYVDKTIKR